MKNFLPDICEINHLLQVKTDYEVMLVSILDYILNEAEKDPGYPYINTKLNILSGKKFEPLLDQSIDFKSKDAVFGWIQGRGLEALVGHVKWISQSCQSLKAEEKAIRIDRGRQLVEKVFRQLELVRKKNNGHLFFTFNARGDFFRINDEGRKEFFILQDDRSLMSDLFYVKGMAAAAVYLGDEKKQEEAKLLFKKILHDIDTGEFRGDQVSFDPKNKVKGIPGVKGQGAWMIALGGLAVFAELFDDEYWLDKGCEYIEYLLEAHCNYRGQIEGLQPNDYVERVSANCGLPHMDADGILSDPGHSLEFIGLAAKFLIILKRKNGSNLRRRRILALCREHFGKIFSHCFQYGFKRRPGGIIKAYDLKSRKPINDDMPWWNLPETIRAAMELQIILTDEEEKQKVLNALSLCSNAFFKNYINEDVFLMAYQTIDRNGNPVDIIPATPDADPGYHTGLSIIDFLYVLEKLTSQA